MRLMLLRASFPCLSPGASQSPTTPCLGLQLEKNYDAAMAAGSDESTTSTRATLEIFGRVTRLGLHVGVPRGTRPARRDAYTAQLEEQVEMMRQQLEADRQRIASLEAAQIKMREFMTQFTASQ